jgi:hypothetical protein
MHKIGILVFSSMHCIHEFPSSNKINFHGPTFINAKGVEVSEIDYFLYKTTAQVLTEKIDDTHVSDHHPIKLKLIRTIYKCRTMKIDLKFAVSNKFF